MQDLATHLARLHSSEFLVASTADTTVALSAFDAGKDTVDDILLLADRAFADSAFPTARCAWNFLLDHKVLSAAQAQTTQHRLACCALAEGDEDEAFRLFAQIHPHTDDMASAHLEAILLFARLGWTQGPPDLSESPLAVPHRAARQLPAVPGPQLAARLTAAQQALAALRCEEARLQAAYLAFERDGADDEAADAYLDAYAETQRLADVLVGYANEAAAADYLGLSRDYLIAAQRASGLTYSERQELAERIGALQVSS